MNRLFHRLLSQSIEACMCGQVVYHGGGDQRLPRSGLDPEIRRVFIKLSSEYRISHCHLRHKFATVSSILCFVRTSTNSLSSDTALNHEWMKSRRM